ncbi:MAG: ABC transporter permease [Desulfobacterales bacterium]|nr:MAG: ABC transporter permease [Desulfobacterales bacterium]
MHFYLLTVRRHECSEEPLNCAIKFLTYSLNQTKIGIHIYALGNNEDAAALSGININRVKIFVYSYCGFLTGAGATFYAAQTLSGDPNLGMPITLDAIAAVALGGVPLIGGRGSAAGVLIGIFIVTIISNILNLANVSTFYISLRA